MSQLTIVTHGGENITIDVEDGTRIPAQDSDGWIRVKGTDAEVAAHSHTIQTIYIKSAPAQTGEPK